MNTTTLNGSVVDAPANVKRAIAADPAKPNIAQSIELRDYQAALKADIFQHWQAGDRRVMAQLPTGGGKTILFAAIALQFAIRGWIVVIVSHREELVTQAADKTRKVSGLPVGVIKAGYPLDLDAPIQSASLQSLVNRPDLLPREKVGLVIIDEAHHSPASTYRKVLERFSSAYQLGATATPARLDGSGFDDLYDALVVGPTVSDLIEQGHLSQFKLLAAPDPMKTEGVRTRQGDYSTGDLARQNSVVQLSGNLIRSYQTNAYGKRCIVFAVNVEHSREIADRYNEAGIPAMHLDGNTPASDRRDALARFEAGELWVLSNCNLFDEGLDIPGIEAVQIAKPTKSLVKWLQMVGRALRPAPGKEHAIILDHTKNWTLHGLPTRPRAWTLEGVQEKGQYRAAMKPDGSVSDEPVPIEIEEADTALEAVTLDPLHEWREAYYDLVRTQLERSYSPGWLYHRLRELKPPLEIWQMYAIRRGYKLRWAWHQFNQQQGVAV